MKANTAKDLMPTATNAPLSSIKIIEDERVIDWKKTQLVQAGFKLSWAEDIALSEEADWRLAIDLLHRGCSQDLATRICGATIQT